MVAELIEMKVDRELQRACSPGREFHLARLAQHQLHQGIQPNFLEQRRLAHSSHQDQFAGQQEEGWSNFPQLSCQVLRGIARLPVDESMSMQNISIHDIRQSRRHIHTMASVSPPTW